MCVEKNEQYSRLGVTKRDTQINEYVKEQVRKANLLHTQSPSDWIGLAEIFSELYRTYESSRATAVETSIPQKAHFWVFGLFGKSSNASTPAEPSDKARLTANGA